MSVAEFFDTMDYAPAPESDSAAREWLDRHSGGFHLFINGAWVEPQDGSWFETTNPGRTGDVLGRISQASPADIDAAVTAARAAQPGWWALGGHGRARYLYALARLVQRHSRLLAVLESLDNGKPIRESRDIDIPLVARHFYHHAGWAQLLEQEFPDQQPHGVCGQIIPWNFPLLMLAWKIAPALAAGNTVVLKPAEYTSLTALKFAELVQTAGLPPGVFNVVTGDGTTGQALVDHPGVDKLAFTGSTEVGRQIRERTAGSGKALTLELGGKSPFIVFDDADQDAAVEGVVDAIWFNQGQVCCAGSRLLVQESVADGFIAKLKRRLETLRVGDPLDKGIDIGAIVAPAQLQRIERLVAQGVAEGGQLWQPSWACPAEGLFFPPSLITDVSPASTVAQEEIFGPVLVTYSFRTPAEAVDLANNSRFGLAASVWTETLALALDIAPKLVAGVVWVNATNLFDAAVGFGGYRESGFGREGGREGMAAYLRPRWWSEAKPYIAKPSSAMKTHPTMNGGTTVQSPIVAIDRTAKLYIGGKQARPDGGQSEPVTGADGTYIGDVARGSRKDIRNAVEAARKAISWTKTSAHNRAQVLYYIAENLAARCADFEARLCRSTESEPTHATREVAAAVDRLFTYAAWADKYDGAVHSPPIRGVAMAMNEPLGVMGIVCPDDAPLLSLISLVAPAVALGNRVVLVPSATHPLPATDLYQVLDTSDVPDGVINIVTGSEPELLLTLAQHTDVDALWYVGTGASVGTIEAASVGNLKQIWTNQGRTIDWFDEKQACGSDFLRRASQVKNIWVPYGE